jgi:AraC-like DNA-binding protein
MMEGEVKARVDGVEYIVKAGDLLIIFPNQIHEYEKIGKEDSFISIFPVDLWPEFRNIFNNKVPISPVIGNAAVNKKFIPLFTEIVETNKQNPPFYNCIMKGYYLILLSEIFQMTTLVDNKLSDHDTIRNILHHCLENYNKDIKLDTMARDLHISKYHISHLFSNKLNMGFNEYIGMLRIADACKLLVSLDKSITEIAYIVGFNSPRSFNRAFLKFVGKTPKQYKNSNSPSLVYGITHMPTDYPKNQA